MGIVKNYLRKAMQGEFRQAYADGYTDRSISLKLAQAESGVNITVENLSYVESALRLLENAFEMADVEPAGIITSEELSRSVRRAALNGEAPLLIDPSGSEVKLVPVEIEKVTADRYKLVGRKGTVSMDDVLLFPWSRMGYRGRSPLSADTSFYRASSTIQLALEVEASLSDEARKPTGTIIPVSEGQAESSLAAHSEAISQLRGEVYLPETQLQEVASGSPSEDWKPRDLRSMPDENLVALREKLAVEVVSSLGVPPGMIAAADRENREDARLFLTGCLRPMARRMEKEFSMKYKQVSISFPSYRAADDRSKGQFLKSLTDSGVDLDRALKIAGIEG